MSKIDDAARAKLTAFVPSEFATEVFDGPAPVVGEDPVVPSQRGLDGGERLVAHAAHLKPSFALSEQNAFATVAFAAEHHETQEIELGMGLGSLDC